MNCAIFHALEPVGGSGFDSSAGAGAGAGAGTRTGFLIDLTTTGATGIGLRTGGGGGGVHIVNLRATGVDSTRGNATSTGFEVIIERMGVVNISGIGARAGGGGLTSTDDFAYTFLFLEPCLFIYKISTKTQHLN